MAGLDMGGGGQSHGKKGVGLRRKKRRVGVRLDMTPMVDVAFLLLIFFMVTTVFRRPLAMEVNMPEKDVKVEVAESNVMTMYIREDDKIFYKMAKGPLTDVKWSEMAQLWKAQTLLNPELIILVKVDRKARYERMVDMMDELEGADMSRFSLIPMEEVDRVLVSDK